MTKEQIGQAMLVAIPVLVPVIIMLVKKVIAGVQPVFLPYLALLTGTLVNVLIMMTTGVGVGLWWGPVLGAAGVGLRELYDQTKKALMARG